MPKYVDCDVIKDKLSRTLCLHEELPALIDSIPAADVRPVVRGEWRKIGKIGCIFVCSACDKTFPCKTDFCPNCGADMREES